MLAYIKVTKVTKQLTHINNFIHSYIFFFPWMTQLRKRGAMWLGFINEGKKSNRFKKKKQRSCVTGSWVSKWGEREREWNRFKKRKKKQKKKEELCDCAVGFRMRGKKRREKEEEKKIEVWVSKIVKKERFKKEEYKRERETYLWIFELDTESTVTGREQWGWECDWVFDLFVWV